MSPCCYFGGGVAGFPLICYSTILNIVMKKNMHTVHVYNVSVFASFLLNMANDLTTKLA